MTQLSGPVGKRPFTTTEWRYVVGNEPGIKEDVNGTSYGLVFSTNSDEAFVGSANQDSVCVVGGGMHVIPAGQQHGVVIPQPQNADRTDLIVVRYDPQWAVGPDDPDLLAAWVGPCRLHRIPGTEGSGAPPYDAAPPGVEDFPLWEVTRSPSDALSQADRMDRRVRTGPNLYAKSLAHIGNDVPLGTRAHLDDGTEYVRVLDDQDNPVWAPPANLYAAGTPLVGGTPPPRQWTEFLRQAGFATVTTQPDGAAIVPFPRPFPSGLLSVQLTLLTGIGVAKPVPASVVMYPPQSSTQSRRPSLSSFHVAVHKPNGDPYGGGSFAIGYEAVGW